ncbi:MAG: hypothetical protein E7604_07570 [Ruminococcaceae bacterium]|nr:hypothetical protein [Oscillospiraceae bacterium]
MKRKLSMLLLGALLLSNVGCGGAVGSTDTQSTDAESVITDAETQYHFVPEEPEGGTMQIIPDITFKTGMQLISQKDHANGDAFSVLGTHDFRGGKADNPRWRLAQWDSGPCLFENRIESDVTTITDGIGRSFVYQPDKNQMTFELDTALYYQGKPAVQGDWWPHLLIEQASFDYASASDDAQAYYRCDADRMVVSFDIRMKEYANTPIDGDWVNAAQFLMYFYVKGVETNDFCWFGLQLFDNRWEKNDHYIGYDGGKADASGAMIYSIGSKYVYRNSGRTLYKAGKPEVGGAWVHVEIDIRPYLDEMLEHGLADGYFDAQSLSELCIDGMNLGWETIGTFDHTMEMRNLRLDSYIDG